MPQLKEVTWVLVADGTRARLLFSRARGLPLEPLPDGAMAARPSPGPSHPDRVAGKDAAAGADDWHRMDKGRFAKELAQRLDDAEGRGAFDRLVLVAPAKTLGDLRGELAERTRRRVVGTVDKDLTKHGDDDIRQQVGQAVAL
jgi:protein required for attachment to host cells